MKSNIMEEITNPSFMNSPWHKVSLPFTSRKPTFIGFYLFSFYFFNHTFDLLFIGFYFFSFYFSISDIKKKAFIFFSFLHHVVLVIFEILLPLLKSLISQDSCHFWNLNISWASTLHNDWKNHLQSMRKGNHIATVHWKFMPTNIL